MSYETPSTDAGSSASPGTVVAGQGDEMAGCPWPVYKQMRDAGGPVRLDSPQGPAVAVSRRSQIDQVLRNPEVFSSVVPVGRLGNVRPLIPIEVDPPQQRKFRKLLDPLFAPQRMKLLEDSVSALVNSLIDGFEGREEIDFATSFSIPFPSQVFLTILGLPLEDLPRLLEMKDGVLRPDHVLGKAYDDPAVFEHRKATAASIYAYYNTFLDLREREPKDDLLSQFLTWEVDGERLTREDILDICFLFLTAGLDTVTASLDCFFTHFARNPADRAALVADLDRVPAFVEELLRWETPVMLVSRVATQDTELAGCPIRSGDRIFTWLGSANTDEEEFADADVVRWDREANRHIAFGGGIHRCLGSNLARLELRVALREWHKRLPDYRVKAGAKLAFTHGIRSVDHFPMELGVSA